MDPALAFRGFVLGFTIAAAVGPISLLVIRRTLAEGRLYGLVSGLGVATADATYGAIAAFGLGGPDRRARQRAPGARPGRWRVPAVAGLADDPVGADGGGDGAPPDGAGYAGAYLSILGLTMANPMTILSFGALFAGLGVTRGATGDATLVVLGVLLGSTTWWVVLTTVVGTLRTRVTPAWIHRINLVSGCLIGAFAIVAIVSVLVVALER